MAHIINRNIPEDEIPWGSDFLRICLENATVLRAKGARLLRHCISITRTIFSNEMRTSDQTYFVQSYENFITNIMADFRDNRDYLDIKQFLLDLFYGRLNYTDITHEQIMRFVDVYYTKLSDAVEEVRMKTEPWDYEPDPDFDVDAYSDEEARAKLENEGYEGVNPDASATEKKDLPEAEMSEEDKELIADAMPDYNIENAETDEAIQDDGVVDGDDGMS